MAYDGRQVREFLRRKYHQSSMSSVCLDEGPALQSRPMRPEERRGDGRSILPLWLLGGHEAGHEHTQAIRWREDGYTLVAGLASASR